jgi:DNA-binding transcriptional ArsR family regulator
MKRRIDGKAGPTDGRCAIELFDRASVAQARKALPRTAVVTAMAEGFSALAHPARLRLLLALDGRELCVCDCSQVLGASLSGTSQHLKELRRMGAITFRAQGKMAYYRLADVRWLRIAEAAAQAVQNAALESGVSA